MPIYEYLCEECRKPFEKLILKPGQAVSCPSCGSGRWTLQFSVVSAPPKSGKAEAVGSGCACTPSTCGCN